jgi:hypothetical protein
MFQNKSHHKINDDRAAESKEGKVNKIHPYRRGSDPELFSPPFAHTECLSLEPMYDAFDH